MEFRIEPVFAALKSPLSLVDDPDRREALERYVEAARLPLERAMFDLLAGLAEAIDQQVAERYRVRLSYRTGALALEVEQQEAPPGLTLAEAEWSSADGEMEKVTIRIPAELKELVTRAAAGAGVSVNSWFIRVLIGAVRGAVRGVDEGEHGRRHREREERHREREERQGRGARLSGWIGNE